MRIEGKLLKSGKWWAVEIPLLRLYTQGKSRDDAYLMAQDAVESMIDRTDFKIFIYPGKDNTFSLGSNNDTALMAFALKQQRAHHGLSAREMSKRLGINSPSAYAKYESGNIKPSLDKFSELLKAIDPDLEPILKIS